MRDLHTFKRNSRDSADSVSASDYVSSPRVIAQLYKSECCFPQVGNISRVTNRSACHTALCFGNSCSTADGTACTTVDFRASDLRAALR